MEPKKTLSELAKEEWNNRKHSPLMAEERYKNVPKEVQEIIAKYAQTVCDTKSEHAIDYLVPFYNFMEAIHPYLQPTMQPTLK